MSIWPIRSRNQRPGIFPWQRGNQFALLVDGRHFFPRMLEAIESADFSVDLELYLLEEGHCSRRLFRALRQAVQRGVQVRCLFDAFGSRGLNPLTLHELQQSGIALQLFNPLGWPYRLASLHRDHRKLLVIDGERAWVGGTGATDQFWNPDPAGREWHELMVEMQGPVVRDWQCLFDRQWHAGGICGWQAGLRRHDLELPGSGAAGVARVAYAEATQHRDILHSLVDRLRRAHRRIWLATPYFLPSLRVRRALARAARRGVDVRLLLTGRETDSPPIRYAGQRYYQRLLKHGVRIYEYQPSFLHLKAVLVDDWCSIGSCNFDRWTLHFNLEANVESVDPGLCLALAGQFEEDFALSHQILVEDWQRRPWHLRLCQRWWGLFDRLALYLLRRHR